MEKNNRLIDFLKSETNKCVFCGFCEPVCPTLYPGKHRGYGPRGRIGIIRKIAHGDKPTTEDIYSIFSCLLCKACDGKCPAKIKITETIRLSRKLILDSMKEKVVTIVSRVEK